MDKGSQFDPTDARAMGPLKVNAPIKTMEGGYNEPGLPKPPAGYGSKLGFEPNVPNSIGC
jgi:hypothetical protein